jgi:hypothetical protein
MAISLRAPLELDLYGDGVSAVFSYDLSKPPVSSGSGSEVALVIGLPSLVVPTLSWVNSPQIGLDVNNNPIYDQPSVLIALVGTTLTLTFGSPLKAFGSMFTDGASNQWPIQQYSVQLTFAYNSLI